MIAIVEAVNYTAIPNFVPSGVLWFAEDTGDLWIGTGSSEPPKVLQIAGSGGSPGGFNGDLQYNNNGSLGGSAATTDAEGDITVPGFLSVASTLFDQTGSAGQTGQFLQTTVNGVLWATASGSGGSPGGSSGDIQFNSGSSFGGSTATITSTGSITIPVNSDLFWGNDTQISRISGGTLSIGVGAHGDETGSLILNNIHLGAGLYDGTGNIGSNNNLLSSTGSRIAWTSTPSVASISSTTATIANAFITTATITTATISGNGYVSTLVSPSATITTLTATTATITNGTVTTATITNGIISTATVTTATLGNSYASTLVSPAATITSLTATTATITSGIISTATITSGIISTATITTATVSGNGYVSTLVSPAATITTLTATTATVARGSLTITDIAANPDLILFNTAAATVTSTNQSPALEYLVNYATSTTQSGLDVWTIGSAVGVGINGTTTLTIGHSGTTGVASVAVPTLQVGPGSNSPCSIWNAAAGSSFGIELAAGVTHIVNNGTQIVSLAKNTTNNAVLVGSGACYSWASGANPANSNSDTSLSRIGAGVMGVGTGAVGSTAGSLQLSKLLGPAANSDITGTISGATTTAAKGYAVNYTAAPIVVVTPTTICSTFYVSSSTAGGYVVKYGPSQAAIFNYCVIGNPS